MLYTSNEEFDLERRVHLTNEIPPYDMYEALNSTLQTTIKNGDYVPTIWKWVLGYSKIGYNLPYSIKREDENGKYEDDSATASIVGKYDVVRDEPDDIGRTPISNGDVWFKKVNGKMSPVYGPRVEGEGEEKLINGLSTMYHKMEIDGVWLPEFDLLLHENYRYLENLYPDHPDYRYLLTDNEIDDSFNAAGAVVDYRPANKFFDKVARSLNYTHRIKGASMSEDEIEQEAIKIKIRNLRNNAFRRKYYGSKTGFKMLGNDIFNSVSVFPVGTYLPIKDVKASELALENQIKNCISDESKWQAELDAAKLERDRIISEATAERDRKIKEILAQLEKPLRDMIDDVQKWYLDENEKLENTESADFLKYEVEKTATFGETIKETHITSEDATRRKWNSETEALEPNDSGEYDAQFQVRAFYDECLNTFNEEMEKIFSDPRYLEVKETATNECAEIVENAEEEYNRKVEEIHQLALDVDSLKEWNREHNLSLSPAEFVQYCRKNNRVIDTYSELYYRKFRLIDWTGEKNSYPVEAKNTLNKTGIALPFYNSYLFIDTSNIKLNDVIEREEHPRELTYVNGIEDGKVRTTQENYVDYKKLYLYNYNLEGISLSSEDKKKLKKYSFKKETKKNDLGEEIIVSKEAPINWYESFISNVSTATRNSLIKEIEVVEKDSRLFLNPRDALKLYNGDELSGERKNSEDLIYPVSKPDFNNLFISQYDVRKDEGLPELSTVSSFVKGQVEFAPDGDASLAAAFYKKLNIKDDQRYALLFENENKNQILVYGSPVIEYGDAGLGMVYIKNVKFNITDIPTEKPENFCKLTGSDFENREYFFNGTIDFEDKDENEVSQERTAVYPGCKVVGMWEASVVTTSETDGTAESYHKIKWGKVDEVISATLKNIHLGYINLEKAEEVENKELDIGDFFINYNTPKIKSDYKVAEYTLNSLNNKQTYNYEDFSFIPKTDISESLGSVVIKSENNVVITTSPKETIEIECVLDADDEELSHTLKFENETAKKVMKTLSIGDLVFGSGIDTDDNNVFITKVGEDFVEISSAVQATGEYILTFEVKTNIFPASISEKPEYFKKELVNFGTYETLNPFKHGLYGSEVWPNTSQAIIDGVDDISMYDDYKEEKFPIVMQKCHSLLNDTKDENGKYIWNLIPSTIKYMNDVFVDLNVSRILPFETRNKKRKECLMSVDWLDYFQDNLSETSRATDKTHVGAHLTMQTDTTGLTSNEHGREYTDPSIKLKFITLNWDNMNMWPEVKGEQTEWTVPAYAQIGTAGEGYRSLFRSIDEITHPNVWGATQYDDIMPSKTQKELSAEYGVLRKRGTWGQDQNYVEPSEADKKYYYSVEEPVFEVPLGEYDTQIDYKFDIKDARHALTKVQASFYKEVFDTIMKYIPTKEGEIESKDEQITVNPDSVINQGFIKTAVFPAQISNINNNADTSKMSVFQWSYSGEWVPSKKEVNGKWQINWPEVEENGTIHYFIIRHGATLYNIDGNKTVTFDDHSFIFKKPNSEWNYRNFVSGGIFGNGILTFNENETDEEYVKYKEECIEAYKGWTENPHMKFDGDLLTSLVRWTLAVSDMGAYLDLDSVDKITFKDNFDLLDEYRNIDHLVTASKDVAYAFDTTCYWFMFTGDKGDYLSEEEIINSNGALGNYIPLETSLNWEKGQIFGLVRDNDGEYSIITFNMTSQFSITMPLIRTQGQANQEFDFIANDSKYGLIPLSEKMTSKIQLPRKFITPGSYKFDFTVDPRFVGEGLKYIIDENGVERPETLEELKNSYKDENGNTIFVDDYGQDSYRHFNMSRSNIYYDSENKCFYTFAEEWEDYKYNEETKSWLKIRENEVANGIESKFSSTLSKFKIKFNENKFFKNTLESTVAYTNKIDLGDSTEVENIIEIENIPSIPFSVDKLSSNDRVIGMQEVLLRSIWNKTLEPSFFSNSIQMDGQILGIDQNNKVFVGEKENSEIINFKNFIRKLGKVEYRVNESTGKYEAISVPMNEESEVFTSSTSPLLSNIKTSFSLVKREETLEEELEKAEFKYFKNTLILKGKVDLANTKEVYGEDKYFANALSKLKKGDVLVDAKSLSATSEPNEVEIILKNKYGNRVRDSFIPVDWGYENNEFVAINKDGIIMYSPNCSLEESTEVVVSEFDLKRKTYSVKYNNKAWEVVAEDGVFKFNTSDASYEKILDLSEGDSYISNGTSSAVVSSDKVSLTFTGIDGDTYNVEVPCESRKVDFIGNQMVICGDGGIKSISTLNGSVSNIDIFPAIEYITEDGQTHTDKPTPIVTSTFIQKNVLVIGGHLKESNKAFIITSRDGVNFESANFYLEKDDGTQINIAEDIETSDVANITYDQNKFVVIIYRRFEAYFVSFAEDEDGNVDFTNAVPNNDVSDSIVTEEVSTSEKQFSTYSIKTINGKMIFRSNRVLDVANGISVVDVSDKISLSAELTMDNGNGTFEVLLAFKTSADVSNQFDFVNKNENIFLPNGSFSVKEVVDVPSYENANRVFSKNEIDKSEDGYPAFKDDVEHKFYEYRKVGQKDVQVDFLNNSGNKIKLCNNFGSLLYTSENVSKTAKDRKNISYSAFRNAATPIFESLKEANQTVENREEFKELNDILKTQKSYISELRYNKGHILVNVDNLSKYLNRLTTFNSDTGKRENILFWDNEQDFIKFMGDDYSASRYVMKPFYEVDNNLEEDIDTEIFEDEKTVDGNIAHLRYEYEYGPYQDRYGPYDYDYDYNYYGHYEYSLEEIDHEETSENKFSAIYDTINGWFVLKKNLYISSGLNVPYAFVGGGKAFTTGDFSSVSTEDFDSPVTGVYMPDKGYGGHRQNSPDSPWLYNKPWDIDPQAFEKDYIKNVNGEFIYVTDKFGTAIESYNCEVPVLSNGETLKITKDSFGGSGEKTITLENGLETSQIKLSYLPESEPTCFVASEKLVLGKDPFDVSIIFLKDGEVVHPEKVVCSLLDLDGAVNTIPVEYDSVESVLRYNPQDTITGSSNPKCIRIVYTLNGKQFSKDVSVEIFSKFVSSQPSIYVSELTNKKYAKDENGVYNTVAFGNNGTILKIMAPIEEKSTWKNIDEPSSFFGAYEKTEDYSTFIFDGNYCLEKLGDYQTISFNINNRNFYAKVPYIYMGDVNAYYTSVSNKLNGIKEEVNSLRVVLLSFVSRISARDKYFGKEDSISIINSWANAILGNYSETPFEVTIFGNKYSTLEGEENTKKIVSIKELISKVDSLTKEENVIKTVLARIENHLNSGVYTFNGEASEFELNPAFSYKGEFSSLVQEFYDSVDSLIDFIDNTKDIKSVYINNKKLSSDRYSFEDSENPSFKNLYIDGQYIKKVPVTEMEVSLTCGFKFLGTKTKAGFDENGKEIIIESSEPEVFITDSNEIDILAYNTSYDNTLILSGIKGRVICRKPKFATFKELINETTGFGYVIEGVFDPISSDSYKSPLASFRAISEDDVNATLDLNYSDERQEYFDKLNDGKKHFVKLTVLTQKDIETTEGMFGKDSFVEIDPTDIVDFPPNRVYYSRQGDDVSNGYPLPPVVFYDVDGNVSNIIRAENNYAYYNKPYTNGNRAPVYECDRNGNFITYTSRDENTRAVDGTDTVADLHQPRRPLYQTCQEWFMNDFFTSGNESNPFWQTIEISSFYDTEKKDWTQTANIFENVKSAKGMKLAKIEDDGDKYLDIYKSAIYKAGEDSTKAEEDNFVDLKNGTLRFTCAVNMKNHRDEKRLVKYGISVFNSFNSQHSYNTENAKVVENEEVLRLYSYLTSKYTVNSKENLVSTNDKDSSIVPITEIGLFNKQHQMIAYAHFPAIEYRSDTQHLDFTMFIYNGVMKS